ncbi:hypothetical protein RBU60_13335 [Mesonia sp. MT50]|uniref:Uncharacterized protein n=1 Tax=Mesonia profundi TaxID=3070998 RepID=A0ABU1A4G3_9FLAO|nr:hypothetical protein [Mesonia profundi]MDQ7918556.1 hypothetical protein [Mesonia profundi]
MDIFVFYILILIVLILFVVGIIYLSYWVPKRFGKKKLGIVISRILIIGTVILILTLFFEDKLFFKSDVKEYLSFQKVELKDDFKLINNESGGLRDYYHKFDLEISNSDRKSIINLIKSAENYQTGINNEFYLPELAKNRYEGDTLYANYQTTWAYKKAIFYPNGKGYTPTYRIISIWKEKNELTFEEILD